MLPSARTPISDQTGVIGTPCLDAAPAPTRLDAFFAQAPSPAWMEPILALSTNLQPAVHGLKILLPAPVCQNVKCTRRAHRALPKSVPGAAIWINA